MERVVTINLNGVAYQLDERAYDRLRAYLDGAARELATNPDHAEILADFEQAIAETCRRYLGPQKAVVTLTDMEAVLAEMGPVVADTDAAPDREAPSPSTEDANEPARRRLYRLPGRGGIAGVCAGIAAYLGVKVSWVRLGFLVLLGMTYGWVVILYAILAFVIPEAHTSDERAAAYGERFDAQSMIDEAKRQATEVAADLRKGGEELRKSFRQGHRHWTAQQRAWRREWRARANRPYVPRTWSPVSIAGQPSPMWAAVAVVVFACFSMATVAMLLASIASLINTGVIYGWQPPPAVPVWATILVLIALFQLANTPLRAARHASYNAWGQRFSFLAMWDGIFATSLTFFVIWVLYRHMPPPEDLGDFIRHLPDAFHAVVQEVVSVFGRSSVR